MKTHILLVICVLTSLSVCNGQVAQRIITLDKKGRLVTTYANNPRLNYSVTYLGSPYLGNTVWHQGALIYRNGREVPAQIAYNIVYNEVYWRLNDSSEVAQALPDEFTFEGQRFIAHSTKPLRVDQVVYYQLLYDGKTKLLRKWTKQLKFIDRKSYSIRVSFDDIFDGEYILSSDLYLQKEGERPKWITPDEYSLSRALPNMGPEVASFIASHQLTDQILVEALMQYDKRLTATP